MGYLIFLLPLWFGWYEMGRYFDAIETRTHVKEAHLAFIVSLTVVCITPAGWLWAHPPEMVALRAGVAVGIAQIALAVILFSALLRLLIMLYIWRVICNRIDKHNQYRGS